MSVAYDAASSATGDNISAPVSWTHTVSGTPTAVAVGIMYWATASQRTISSITYGAGNLSVAPNNPSGFSAANLAATVWGLANPASGNQTVTVTFSGNGAYATFGAVSVTGSDTAQCFSTGGGASGTSAGSTTLSVAVPSAADELVFAHGGTDGSPTTTLTVAGTGTERYGPLASGDVRAKGLTAPGGSPTVTAQINSTQSLKWAMAGASFKNAGSAAVVSKLMLMGVGP